MGEVKTRPTKKATELSCPRCGCKDFRKKGIAPTNTEGHEKSWYKEKDKRHIKQSYARRYYKVYVCRNCKATVRCGNAGRYIR